MEFCMECSRRGSTIGGLCASCHAKWERKRRYRIFAKGLRKWTLTFGLVTFVFVVLKVIDVIDVPRIVSVPLCLTLGSWVTQVLWRVWMEGR